MYYLIFPELKKHFSRTPKKLKTSQKKRPKKSRSKKSCKHTKNFSCFHSEQTVIVNGKKQHDKQNKCKCYECGMEF